MLSPIACDPACSSNTECIGNTCQCIDGWSGNDCDVPICNTTCNNGTCVAPNTCQCDEGYMGLYCTTPVCDVPCNNGTCVAPNTCQCDEGYEGLQCTIPVCNPSCNATSACIAPNTCQCHNCTQYAIESNHSNMPTHTDTLPSTHTLDGSQLATSATVLISSTARIITDTPTIGHPSSTSSESLMITYIVISIAVGFLLFFAITLLTIIAIYLVKTKCRHKLPKQVGQLDDKTRGELLYNPLYTHNMNRTAKEELLYNPLYVGNGQVILMSENVAYSCREDTTKEPVAQASVSSLMEEKHRYAVVRLPNTGHSHKTDTDKLKIRKCEVLSNNGAQLQANKYAIPDAIFKKTEDKLQESRIEAEYEELDESTVQRADSTVKASGSLNKLWNGVNFPLEVNHEPVRTNSESDTMYEIIGSELCYDLHT